jgi:hypothetical protein
VAAGSDRGDAIVDVLIASKSNVHDITDVVWDPGYSRAGAMWHRRENHHCPRSGVSYNHHV